MKKRKILLILILILAAVLRIWKLDSNPVSLFGDELDVGYHAYSILKTGKDYSGNFLPMHFRSLAEWRTPLYIYSAVPTVGIFGISPLGVRLPAAIFGFLGIWVIYLLVKKITNNSAVSLITAFFLAISPWHLQYSRAGFEVTELLFFYMIGIYFLLRGLKTNEWLFLAAIFLGLTPWIYSTAKLFLPLTLVAILIIWWKQFKTIRKKYLLGSILILTLIVGPFTFNTIFGGGTQRIEGISIFNDPMIIPKIGFERLNDIKTRDKNVVDTNQAIFIDKFFHNQPLSFLNIFLKNYFQVYSPEFLFIKGDINPRHSLGIGEFYKVQIPFLLLGFFFLLTRVNDKKIKIFLVFWIFIGSVPSALTKDGGMHATRLILILPTLIILTSLGIYFTYQYLSKKLRLGFVIFFSALLALNFIFYQHNYWVHYPWESQEWWHAGYEEAIKSAVEESENYKKVIISSAMEPSLIFFLGWSMYPPDQFHDEYNRYLQIKENSELILKLGKYEFPQVGQSISLYELGVKLPDKSLYLATAKEIVIDLNKEPQRIPKDVKLIKIINYPSGNPAFYLFTKS